MRSVERLERGTLSLEFSSPNSLRQMLFLLFGLAEPTNRPPLMVPNTCLASGKGRRIGTRATGASKGSDSRSGYRANASESTPIPRSVFDNFHIIKLNKLPLLVTFNTRNCNMYVIVSNMFFNYINAIQVHQSSTK